MKRFAPAFAALAACAFALGVQPALAGPTMGPMPMATTSAEAGFGQTSDFQQGYVFSDVYTRNFYCDTSVPAKSSTGCEVGATFKKPPARQFDPLYITVPLGFTVNPMQMQCPNGLVCIDHPATIDLSAIGGPTNAMTPGHDHFTTDTNNFLPEWWNVEVIGVKSKALYNSIRHRGSYNYIAALIKAKNPDVVGPLPTNLFLYFAVVPPGSE